MKSQTTLVARKCRLNEWTTMVQDCKNRPAGMSVDEWCRLHSITKSNYYYRMKQVRLAYLDVLELDEKQEHFVVPVPLKNERTVKLKAEKKSHLILVPQKIMCDRNRIASLNYR